MRAHTKPMGPKPRPKSDRFAENFERREPDECWPWIGLVNDRNRGKFYWDAERKMINAPRAALLLSGVELRPDQLACHTCDNANCVNPRHLYAGSHSDNIHDAYQRLRRLSADQAKKGVEHHQAVLDDDKVREIRRRFAAGETGKSLGLAFGVANTTISMVCKGKTWKHVSTP